MSHAHTRFGQYEVVELIRRGGMSAVYKGYQPSLDRSVAIKVLLQHQDAQFAERFKREARAIGQLEHHNILPIYDYGEQDGQLYFVMQQVEHGYTLRDMMGEPIEPIAALRLVERVLDGLSHAHRRGVIHRDIKPSNILLPLPDWPLLADFGIAKFADEQQSLTVPGALIGTAAYMAPEQADGRPADERTDLYSLGVVLFEMVTGRVPFDAKTPVAMLQKHIYEPPPPPRSLNPHLPEPVEQVLLRALAKDPAARYQNASEMAVDVRRVIAEVERSQGQGRIGELYRAGVRAFGAGDWRVAIEQLQQVAAADPKYQHVQALLTFARQAQQRAETEGQAQLERLERRAAGRGRARPADRTPYQTQRFSLADDLVLVEGAARTDARHGPPVAPERLGRARALAASPGARAVVVLVAMVALVALGLAIGQLL